MLWPLLASHVVGMAASALLGRRSMRHGLIAASIAPAVTAVWAITQLGREATVHIHEARWVEALDLTFRFRTDAFAMMMTVIVSGIGALVFVYATGYFGHDAKGGVRFPATLLAFSTSMLGLVLADSVWTLFIFWELTSITSFLLVGHKFADPAVQTAARRALAVTGGGGLALLAGLLVLADGSGTTILSDLAPVSGTSGSVAAVLILIGVATKSAQVPFHVWLPGAMAAPTPVSAYLHSATMVKAGIVLMAVTGGAFGDVAMWKALGFAFGAVSMLWGGYSALRHRDAKLILAWGTISQLGLLVTLLALGSGKAVFAATSILVAHALFKAALFLVVGEIDIRTGTRDIAELGGLHRTMPLATFSAVLAGMSMAGIPPLLGFPAKEAAIEAALGLSGTERALALVTIVTGSVLTVAYTVRFLWCVFGPGPATRVDRPRVAMTVPAIVLSGAGLFGFITLDWVNGIVGPAATELSTGAAAYQLLRWPGLTTAFALSLGVIVIGACIGSLLARREVQPAPAPVGATRTDELLDGVLVIARRVTARVQHGSLPVYLATMAATAVAATAPFFTDVSFGHVTRWDHPLQLALALAISAAALAGAFVASRLGAALTLGAVGIGVCGLFVLHGAPDLALTQLLVETVVVVGFVVGLGHLARRFPPAKQAWRSVRIAIAAGGGISVVVALAAAGAAPAGVAPTERITREAVAEGGGNNLVNVILTDMRALDTLGEVVVLATVALGILALTTTAVARPAEARRGASAASEAHGSP